MFLTRALLGFISKSFQMIKHISEVMYTNVMGTMSTLNDHNVRDIFSTLSETTGICRGRNVGQRAPYGPYMGHLSGVSILVWKTWSLSSVINTAESPGSVWPKSSAGEIPVLAFQPSSRTFFQMTTKVTINWCCVTHNERFQSHNEGQAEPLSRFYTHTRCHNGR